MLQGHRLHGYFKRNREFPVILIKMADFVSLMLVAMAVVCLLAPGPFFFEGLTALFTSTIKDNQVFQVSADTAKLFFSRTNNFGLNGGTINF